METSSVKIAPSTLEEMQYLYEPNASLMKAGCFGVLSGRYDARMLSKNSHLFVSREPIAAFPGRSFRIIAVSCILRFLSKYRKDTFLVMATSHSPNFEASFSFSKE